MPRTLEQWLAAVRDVDATRVDVVRGALAVRKPGAGVVIAAAAKHVVALHLDAVVPELVDAFAGLLGDDAVKRDPGSRGKIAIARTLHELDHWDDAVFAVGLHVTQPEGWPAAAADDTAAELRGICGLAHAHFARGDALDVLAEMLADPFRIARLAAAQGIGDCGRRDGTAVLRYKLVTATDEPDVLAACLDSLFALGRDPAAAFAIELLARDDDRADAAALALGGARVADAFTPLVAWSTRCAPEVRHRVGYLALALLRSDEANAHLLDVIRTGSHRDVVAAARAVATFKDDPAVAAQLAAAVRGVKDRELRAELAVVIR